MTRLPRQLPRLQAALTFLPARPQAVPATPADVDALIRAIRRKARFVEMHMAVLLGIEWNHVESIGRRGTGAPTPFGLSVRLSDASLIIEHSEAVIDHVYLAFDGLTAALVNIADTLGRLINVSYGLGIPLRTASLLAVRDRCAPTSALGMLLSDPAQMDWFKRVRELRGRCQHADVDDILTSASGPYSRRGQPSIAQSYSWCTPPQERPIVSYAQEATMAAEDCVLAAIGAIVAAPSSAIY